MSGSTNEPQFVLDYTHYICILGAQRPSVDIPWIRTAWRTALRKRIRCSVPTLDQTFKVDFSPAIPIQLKAASCG